MTLDQQEVIDALPNYEVGAELGRGGWGVVLAGRHRQLGREVAIKQLPRAFAADESVRARFVTEARLLASLDHPHIVPVYDFVERDGLCLLVMEQLPSGTLWSRFSTDGFTQPAAAAAVLAAIAGLQAAHEHQILHRDVKPENLMFSATGALKVTDFGIAKVVGGDGTLATRAGEVVGTPAYIAPEQARGGELSPATDVYAVATMFYELLSGQLPFADDADAMALLFKHAFETPTPFRDRAPFVPEGIAEVVMRGLATDPGDRYATAEAFGVAIAEACTNAWGPGWLAAEGTPVMGASSIVSATDRITSPPRPPTVSDAPLVIGDVPAPPTVGDVAAPAPPTVGDVAAPAAPAPPTVAAPTAPVHPAGAAHEVGVQLQDVQESDLVPVQSVLIPPAKATVPLLLAVLGLILVVVIAAFGIGSPDHSGDLHAGTVTVAGIDPTSGHVVTLDLSKNVPVGVTAAAPGAARVRLTVESVGQHISQASAPLLVVHGTLNPPSGGIASIDASSARYLAGGRLEGEIELMQGGVVVAHQQFPVKTKETGLLTAGGAATIVLLLFALAYGESFARSLRRGRRTRSATFGLGVMGALVGLGLVSLMSVTGFRSPTIATVVVCMVLGAATGVAFAIGAVRVGKGRRFAKVQKQRAL